MIAACFCICKFIFSLFLKKVTWRNWFTLSGQMIIEPLIFLSKEKVPSPPAKKAKPPPPNVTLEKEVRTAV